MGHTHCGAIDSTLEAVTAPRPRSPNLQSIVKRDPGNRDAVARPRALPGRDDLEFSFSGFKTAVATLLGKADRPVGLAFSVGRWLPEGGATVLGVSLSIN